MDTCIAVACGLLGSLAAGEKSLLLVGIMVTMMSLNDQEDVIVTMRT